MKTLCSILTNEPAKQMVIGCFGRDITLAECTKPNLKTLAAYMQENVCKNSARTYAAYIKSALNLHKETEEIPANFALALKIKGEGTISVYLTEEELKRLILAPMTQKERYYMLHFFMSSFAGCRCSDVKNITATNITDGILRYICQKTGFKAEVPAKKEVVQWIAELQSYKDMNFCDRTYLRIVKEVCKRSGINSKVKVYRGGKAMEDDKWKFVGTHTARRSFATNLYLRGYDLYTISRYMGHSSMEMTSKYICSEVRKVNDDFFND